MKSDADDLASANHYTITIHPRIPQMPGGIATPTEEIPGDDLVELHSC